MKGLGTLLALSISRALGAGKGEVPEEPGVRRSLAAGSASPSCGLASACTL